MILQFEYLSSVADAKEIWRWARNLINTLNKLLGENRLVPTGARVIWHAGVDPPDGWLLCDGSSYAITTYPALFNLIGYTYGGAGADFNVPSALAGFTSIIKS